VVAVSSAEAFRMNAAYEDGVVKVMVDS